MHFPTLPYSSLLFPTLPYSSLLFPTPDFDHGVPNFDTPVTPKPTRRIPKLGGTIQYSTVQYSTKLCSMARYENVINAGEKGGGERDSDHTTPTPCTRPLYHFIVSFLFSLTRRRSFSFIPDPHPRPHAHTRLRHLSLRPRPHAHARPSPLSNLPIVGRRGGSFQPSPNAHAAR